MVNALFSSRVGGTKCFLLNGTCFGWSAITSMYERECVRVNSGLTRMVPKLKETHVIRDSWTKLNVSPAKIMQVCIVFYMDILYMYVSSKSMFYLNCSTTLVTIHNSLIRIQSPTPSNT